MPTEGVDRVRLECRSQDGSRSYLRVVEQGHTVRVFGPAPAPQHRHARKRKDGPAPPPECRTARTHLVIGEAKKSRKDEREKEQSPKDGLGDEHNAARIPARIEGEKRPHAIIVGPVKGDMAESGDESSEIEPAPVHGLGLLSGRPIVCPRRRRREFTKAAPFAPSVQQPDQSHDDSGHHRHGNERVGDAAMVL